MIGTQVAFLAYLLGDLAKIVLVKLEFLVELEFLPGVGHARKQVHKAQSLFLGGLHQHDHEQLVAGLGLGCGVQLVVFDDFLEFPVEELKRVVVASGGGVAAFVKQIKIRNV